MLVWGDRHDTALDFLQEDSGQQFPLQKTVLITVIVFSVSFLTSYFYLLLRQGVCLLRLSLRRVFLDLATMASSKFPPTGSLGHRPAFQGYLLRRRRSPLGCCAFRAPSCCNSCNRTSGSFPWVRSW